MRWTTTGAALFALALGVGASMKPALASPEDEKTPPPAAEQPPIVKQSAAETLKELSKAYSLARGQYSKKVQEARAEHGDDWRKHTGETAEQQFLPRYVEAAQTFAGSEDAVAFLQQVVGLGQRCGKLDVAKAALSTLTSDHRGSAKLSGLTYTLIRGDQAFGKETIEQALETILSKTPHDDVKAAMLFARGSRSNNPKASAEAQAAAIADLRKAGELGGKSAWGERALGVIFELEHLQMGMVAPDISGSDLDGVAFKLSDYRGKVVVLDFWGDW